MADNKDAQVKYISGDEFDKIWLKPVGTGWRATYARVLRDLKVDEAVVIPCGEACWKSRKNACASSTHVYFVLGSGNFRTKHIEARGTPNNHIAVQRLR